MARIVSAGELRPGIELWRLEARYRSKAGWHGPGKVIPRPPSDWTLESIDSTKAIVRSPGGVRIEWRPDFFEWHEVYTSEQEANEAHLRELVSAHAFLMTYKEACHYNPAVADCAAEFDEEIGVYRELLGLEGGRASGR